MNKTLVLARMLQFGDSMLPVGAFAFSSGVESAVQKGVIRNVEDLRQYAQTALEQAARGDAVALAWATRTALQDNLEELLRIDQEVFRRKLCEETRVMVLRMGKKLAEMGVMISPTPLLTAWSDAIREQRTPGTHAVSWAVLFTALGLSSQADAQTEAFNEALTAYFYGVAMTILNASLRLMRITHIDIQRILFRLTPEFEALCQRALQTPLAQMSNYAPMTDILAANHVKARVRLFMN